MNLNQSSTHLHIEANPNAPTVNMIEHGKEYNLKERVMQVLENRKKCGVLGSHVALGLLKSFFFVHRSLLCLATMPKTK